MSEAEADVDFQIAQAKIEALERQLAAQTGRNDEEIRKLQSGLSDLENVCKRLEDENGKTATSATNSDVFARRVEWVIEEFSKKEATTERWSSIWSPPFKAAGMEGLQLEFFPKGREKTSYDGFCSLFLWCHDGTKIKYQLFVGNFLRAPDEDEYNGRIGHGHSNFCPLEPEVNRDKDTLTVGVDFLEVIENAIPESRGLKLITRPLEKMIDAQAEILRNRNVKKVTWKITEISKKIETLAQGTSIWSKLFTAGGIKDMLLEFYPNGSVNTKKKDWCAFYIRCPEGSKMVVTLFVGKATKGPIQASFDSLTGKGLPDFCCLLDQVNQEDDSVEVGIELQTQPIKTLNLQS